MLVDGAGVTETFVIAGAVAIAGGIMLGLSRRG
jgi:hypothetical protein